VESRKPRLNHSALVNGFLVRSHDTSGIGHTEVIHPLRYCDWLTAFNREHHKPKVERPIQEFLGFDQAGEAAGVVVEAGEYCG
jgi:hypothetical protein